MRLVNMSPERQTILIDSVQVKLEVCCLTILDNDLAGHSELRVPNHLGLLTLHMVALCNSLREIFDVASCHKVVLESENVDVTHARRQQMLIRLEHADPADALAVHVLVDHETAVGGVKVDLPVLGQAVDLTVARGRDRGHG